MRGIFMYDNGRLKTGRVSLLFFLSLILGLSLLFHLHKPVDKAVVVVRHIFAATPTTESKKPPLKEPEKPTPQPRQEPIKLAENTPTEEPNEVKEKNKTLHETTAYTQPEKAEPRDKKKTHATIKSAEITPEPTPTETIASSGGPTTGSPAAEAPSGNLETTKLAIPKPLLEPLVDENQQKDNNEKNMSLQAKIDPEELVVDFQQAWQPAVEAKRPTVSLMSKAARQYLRENLSRHSAPETPKESQKFTAVNTASNKRVDFKKNPEKRVEQSEIKLAIPATATVKEIETRSITVDKQEYAALHRAWRAVGEGEKENDRIIPLQIENLRSAYSFLQMKAVVILADNKCIDLHDGSRIPAASLDRFSSTVMRVDDPWQKWEFELRRAGLRPGQSFEVRYYLYDFVRRSIYARVNQAYKWILNRGLVQAGTRPTDVDVLGRAYVVKRSGGGSFGVFVPLSLATRDGQIIEVDPLCFNNAPDIAALHAAGVI